MNTRLAILTIFALLILPACGVLEVGLEELPPRETAALPPTLAFPPTVTIAPTLPADFDPLQPGQKIRLTSIRMLDKMTGWGIGQVGNNPNDYLLLTSDGGRAWQNRTPRAALQTPPPQGLSATAFFGPGGLAWVLFAGREAYTPSGQVVWRTSDYGQTWQASAELSLEGLPTEHFYPDRLGFLDDRRGWLVARLGAGMSHDYIAVFLTDDGGQTWRTPTLLACVKIGLAFSTPLNGWLTAGDCPGLRPGLLLYSTRDGGETWQPVNLPVPPGQPADLFTTSNAGCSVPILAYASADAVLFSVRCSPFNGGKASAWLYATQTGGAFSVRALPQPYGNLQFLNPQEGWFIGAQTGDPAATGEIYHTLDGGQTWKLVILTAWQGVPNFIDSNTGWVIAQSGEKLALVYTANGGALWEEINAVVGKE